MAACCGCGRRGRRSAVGRAGRRLGCVQWVWRAGQAQCGRLGGQSLQIKEVYLWMMHSKH
eukprot:366045-Chlamydomonas_euryale.AAC.1